MFYLFATRTRWQAIKLKNLVTNKEFSKFIFPLVHNPLFAQFDQAALWGLLYLLYGWDLACVDM